MLEHVEFCMANDLPIRIILLKARQIGATTFFAALGFWYAAMHKNTSYGIVAHRFDSSESIFQKCKVFYNNMPTELQPSTTQFSGDGITFDKKNGKGINSKIKFATVNDGVYRGQTFTYLHESEYAFWEGDIEAINNSLNPTIADTSGTIKVVESTAKGYNTFKDKWDRAVRGESDETPFFFGWQGHAEYTKPAPKGFELTDEEEVLKEKFNLTDDQLYWRRTKIDTDYQGNKMYFAQEYPMTPEEAFVASGGGVFDPDTIIKGYASAKQPIAKERLKTVDVFERLMVWEQPEYRTEKNYAKKSVWSDEEQKYIYVDTDLLLEEVTYQSPYTLGIDTAGMGADKNQVVVVNNVTKKVAARFEKKNVSEEMLAAIAVEIAKKYNNALIAPETNYSHEICNYIIKLGYKNIFITESVARQDVKVVGGIEYGWKTTTASKPPMISYLRSVMNAHPENFPDKEFWFEAEYYLLLDVQKSIMGASSGHHDDVIIATAIALYVSNSLQAKQNRAIVKKSEQTSGSIFAVPPKPKKTLIRKGLYNNNA